MATIISHFIVAFISLVSGGALVYFLADYWRKELIEQARMLDAKELDLRADQNACVVREQGLKEKSAQLDLLQAEFQRRVVSYEELFAENSSLKVDLRNLDITVRKSHLDAIAARQQRQEVDGKVNYFGSRYLKESAKWIASSLNPNNFANCKQRLDDVIHQCQEIGLPITPSEVQNLHQDLVTQHHKIVRAAAFREEQARLRAQMREVVQRQQDIEREQKRLAREKQAVEEALATALALANNQYSAEVERLKAQLADAESRQRSISQAQLTKAGHVYVISNIGSFGEGVFKVGMTRRLVPQERIIELGDASVPFPFDVHMMIECDDAPALETAIHRELHKTRVNKTNPKKEFFRSDITTIYNLVTLHHGTVEYVADPEAIQYRQSLTMSDAEEEFIEKVFAQFENAAEPDADEE